MVGGYGIPAVAIANSYISVANGGRVKTPNINN